MIISLLKKHISFAISPLRLANSLSDYQLLKQLKTIFSGYFVTHTITQLNEQNEEIEVEVQGHENDMVQIDINAERFIQLYKAISGMPEGMTSKFSIEILNDFGNEPGLTSQIAAGLQAADPEWQTLYSAVIAERTAHANTLQNHIAANLSFLQNLDI